VRQLQLWFLASAVVFFASSGTARAQDGGVPMPSPLCPAAAVGCDAQGTAWAWHAMLFDAIDLDSGWVPAGSPIQLHLGLHLAGMTDIGMAGTVVTSWPTPLTVGIEGSPMTGTLAVDYGYELIAQMRFSLDVAGVHYAWTGDIPLPASIPRTISLMGTTVFDPFVLPTSSPRPVTATTTTARVPIFSYDALGGFISVPGVGGGIAVDLQGAMTAAYKSDRIVVATTDPITEEGATTRLLPVEAAGFGPSVDVTAHPEGTLDYSGAILIYPNLYLSIAGRRFDYDLATIPLPISGASSPVVFEDETVHVPLPDVTGIPTMLDFGMVDVGMTHEELLDVTNGGEADLVVHVRPLSGAAFVAGADTLTVPPRSTERLALDFTPLESGPAAATLFLDTNDPDHPLLVVALRGDGIAPPPPPDMEFPLLDAGTPPDAGIRTIAMGGCCRVASTPRERAPLALLALLAGLVVVRKRRR